MTFQTLGADAIGAAIEANCAAAKRLAGRIEASTLFELAAPVPLNIVCFSLYGETRRRPQPRTGHAACRNGVSRPPRPPASTAATVIRAAIFNHRTSFADIDAFFEARDRDRRSNSDRRGKRLIKTTGPQNRLQSPDE